jgi:NADH:ubiquinone oxidoreductase subunit 6 (subunit J)
VSHTINQFHIIEKWFLSNSHFVAAVQLLIYVEAINVLIFFCCEVPAGLSPAVSSGSQTQRWQQNTWVALVARLMQKK